MRLITWAELETKIRTDYDVQDPDNIFGQDEMAALCNESIDSAEALIMRTREDYFLTSATLTLVQSASTIALPTDIYGQKIRELVYKNGDRIFPITRLKDPKSFYQKAVIDRQSVSLDEYKWFLQAATAGAQDSLVITPAALESGAFLELWYIRHASRILLQAAPDSASRANQLACTIDIPEWRVYLEQYIKMRVVEKLKGSGSADFARMVALVGTLGESMIITLKDRAEDNENEVAQDVSHYVEHN